MNIDTEHHVHAPMSMTDTQGETSVRVCEYINLSKLSGQQALQQGQVVSHSSVMKDIQIDVLSARSRVNHLVACITQQLPVYVQMQADDNTP